MWAALDMTPGIQMRGYDVAGTHKGEQTEYETFGIRGQNRIVHDGVNTTEGTDRAGAYFDYYAMEEFKVTGQGAGVEMSTPGAQVVATWKSGTNRLTGAIQGSYGTEDLVNDNFDDDLAARGATPAELREFYEYHVDLGGPIVKDRAWFYAAYNRFFVDKPVSGQDAEIAAEIADFDMVTGKLNIRLTDKDQIIGSGHWSFEQRPNGGLSLTVPPDSVLAQESTTKLFKGEWQRQWSDRLSSTVLVGYFGSERQTVPVVDPGAQPAPARHRHRHAVRRGVGPVHDHPLEAAVHGPDQLSPPHREAGEPRPEARLGLAHRPERTGLERGLRRHPLPRQQRLRAAHEPGGRARRPHPLRQRAQHRRDRPQPAHRLLRPGRVAPERPPDLEPRVARGQAGPLPHGERHRPHPDRHLRPRERSRARTSWNAGAWPPAWAPSSTPTGAGRRS